jgi:hypothetical protein
MWRPLKSHEPVFDLWYVLIWAVANVTKNGYIAVGVPILSYALPCLCCAQSLLTADNKPFAKRNIILVGVKVVDPLTLSAQQVRSLNDGRFALEVHYRTDFEQEH